MHRILAASLLSLVLCLTVYSCRTPTPQPEQVQANVPPQEQRSGPCAPGEEARVTIEDGIPRLGCGPVLFADIGTPRPRPRRPRGDIRDGGTEIERTPPRDAGAEVERIPPDKRKRQWTGYSPD